MSRIILPHGEITRLALHATGEFLRRSEIEVFDIDRSKEAFAGFAVEYVDGVIRDMSKWLPSPRSEPGLLNLFRLVPELQVLCNNGLLSDFTCDVLEPYRQRIHDALVAANVDWDWAEYQIVQFDADCIYIQYFGDRRIREWERTNKTKDVATARANYAATRKTIRYPNGVLLY